VADLPVCGIECRLAINNSVSFQALLQLSLPMVKISYPIISGGKEKCENRLTGT